MDLFPHLTPVSLSSVESGSLVIHGGKLSIVTMDSRDPRQTRMLAAFDDTARAFVHTYTTDPTDVLKVGGDVVIEPDLRGSVDLRRGTRQDLSRIFIHGGDAYGILEMPQGLHQFFNFGTGKVKPSSDNMQMAACSKWRLGIRDSARSIHWLIEI